MISLSEKKLQKKGSNMSDNKQSYSYKEVKGALNSRINAHAQYSNFNLHEWIKTNFLIKGDDKILDVGCGNGNYTRLFWDLVKPNGRIIGLDKNENLIQEAIDKYADLPGDQVQFHIHNYDDRFLDDSASFDWIFAIYSLYYTEDSLNLVEILKNKLRVGGRLVVIGPAPENAKDLADFSFELTGIKPNKEYIERIERIEKEFLPLFKNIFGETKVYYQAVDSVMQFPTAESYAEYYFSTLLWRESTEGQSQEKVEELMATAIRRLSESLPAKINKQMSCLIGEVK